MSKTGKVALLLAAVNSFLIVAIGAFGAHVLEQFLSEEMMSIFNTGIRYHMFHIPAFLATAQVSMFTKNKAPIVLCIWLFSTGIVLFSGSLYLLALTGITALGMITPLGGLAFLLAWALLISVIISCRAE